MKRTTAQLLTLLAVILMAVSCSNAPKNKIILQVQAINEQCPIDLGIMGEITRVSYEEDENLVQFVCSINENLVNIDALKSCDLVKKSAKLGWQNEESKNMIKTLLEAGATLTMTYKCGDRNADFNFTAEELQEIVDFNANDNEINVLYLENQAGLTNLQCPLVVDEMTVMTGAEVKNNTWIYFYEIDESSVSIEDIKAYAPTLKTEIKAAFNDPMARVLKLKLVEAGYNLEYRYKGNSSGEETSILFTPDELQ